MIKSSEKPTKMINQTLLKLHTLIKDIQIAKISKKKKYHNLAGR